MKKLLVIGACLVALAFQPVMAQASGPEVVVVQVYYTGISTGHVLITRGVGKAENIEFAGRSFTEAGEVVQGAIAKLYQEGFSLKSTFSSAVSTGSMLVFVKGQ